MSNWSKLILGSSKKGKTGFGGKSTAEEVSEGVDGSGLTAIVTGGTNGIGKETVRVFAKRGVHVLMAVRNLEAAGKVKEEILKEIADAKVDLLKLDTSSVESVRKAADAFLALNLPLNILVCNAGVMFIPFQLTSDGIEKQFATNYLGHFLLTNLLLDKLKTTAKESGIEGKIINVSSLGHAYPYKEGIRFEKLNDEDGYNQHNAYGQSKLAQILATCELSRQLQEEGANVTVNAVHPGFVKTNLINVENHGALLKGLSKVVLACLPSVKTPAQGAATQVYVALNPQAAGVTGKYYDDVDDVESLSKFANDADLAKKMWDFSVQMTTPKLGNGELV